MNPDIVFELLWIVQRLDSRVSALEMDSEGRGADSQREDIEKLLDAVKKTFSKPRVGGFRKGDRVQFSPEALSTGNYKKQRQGTVAANPQVAKWVAVTWDGARTRCTYSVDFIELIPAEPTAELDSAGGKQ